MATQDPYSLGPTGSGMNTGTEQGIKGKVTDLASHAKDTAADWGRSAASTVDRNLQSAAGALESTASALRENAPASGKVNEIAAATADKIQSTARYLRQHDTSELVSSVESVVRRNPGVSIAAAAALGFLLGTALKKDKDY